jgi:hypothetical protein
MNLVARHETYFLQAIEEHGKCSHALREAKDRAFDAGLFLLSSKDVYEKERPGEWLTYAETFADKLPVRTGFLYRKFAEGMLLQAQEANPRLKDRTKLILLARQTVLDSALTFMELCRELGLVRAREGGGRRSDNALLRHEQFNFDFGILDDSLWALERNGAAALKEVPAEKLQHTCKRLELALQMANAELCSRRGNEADSPVPLSETPDLNAKAQSHEGAIEEPASERVERSEADTWWKAYRLPSGEYCAIPADEKPSFDSIFSSAGVYVTGKYLASDNVDAHLRAKKIFAQLEGNTPVDNSVSLTPCLQAGVARLPGNTPLDAAPISVPSVPCVPNPPSI